MNGGMRFVIMFALLWGTPHVTRAYFLCKLAKDIVSLQISNYLSEVDRWIVLGGLSTGITKETLVV